MTTAQDVLDVLLDVRDYVNDLPTKLLIKAGQIVIYSGLSDISESLGMIQAGEFRAGNRNIPGTFLKTAVAGSGFTGMRMAYPALTYDLGGTPTEFHLVGINDDVIQFGVNAEDGTLVAGAGAVVLSSTGIVATAGTIAGWTINSDHLLSPGTPGIKIDSNGSIETTNFVSGIGGIGWKISEEGDAEFNNAVVRGELRTTVLTYQEVQAVSGTMGVFQSAGVLSSDLTLPAVPSGTYQINTKSPNSTNPQIFDNNHILQIKNGTQSSWFIIDGGFGTSGDGYYWLCTYLSGTTDVTYTTGQAVISYGVSGDGFLLMEAIGTGSPYFSVRTHAGAPYTANTEHVRMGNLNGWGAYASDVYGVAIGQYAAGKSNIAIDDTGILSIKVGTTERIGMTSAGILTIKNSSGNAVFTFDASAGAEFTLPLTLATTGGIYQGTGTFASPTTGLKIWNDGGVGRIGGYNTGTVQWYAGTDGKLYAGDGKIIIDSIGIRLQTITQPFWPQANDSAVIRFYEGANTLSSIYEYRVTSPRLTETLKLTKNVATSGYELKGIDLLVRTDDGNQNASVSVFKRLYPSSVLGVLISADITGSGGSSVLVSSDGINLSGITREIELHDESVTGSYSSVGKLQGYKGAVRFLRNDDAVIPLLPVAPWTAAAKSYSFIYSSYNPLRNINNIMYDECYVGRHLTPHVAGHSNVFSTPTSIADYQLFYKTNSTCQYYEHASGSVLNSHEWVTIIMWFYPEVNNVLQGLFIYGVTTPNCLAYITASNAIVFEIFDTGGATGQVYSNGTIVLNKWNYAVFRYQRTGTSYINLNGVKGTASLGRTYLRNSAGSFRLGYNSYGGYFNGALGWFQVAGYLSDNVINNLVDMSKSWHGG